MSDAPSPIALTQFSTLLERRSRDDARVTFEITPDWVQGRTAFGGLTTALSVQSMRDVTGADWPLRSLQTSFIAPVNGRCDIEVRLLRQGRNVRQVQATVHSEGAVGAVVLGVFGVARATTVPALRPTMPPASHPFDEHVETSVRFGPAFLQHFRRRWHRTEFPFSGSNNWRSNIWIAPRDPNIDAELTAVLLADIPPSPALSFLTQLSASSSVSWELELLPQATPADPGFHRVDTEVIAAADGFVSQRSTLWTPDGQLAALGYQVVGVYG